MYVHIGLFVLLLMAALLAGIGRIPLDSEEKRKGFRLLLLAGMMGNLLGLLLTVRNIREAEAPVERIARKSVVSHEDLVMHEEDSQEEVAFKIPPRVQEEKEETEKERDGVQEDGTQEILEEAALLNREKADPDYYYLPAEYEGRILTWTRIPEKTGSLIAVLGMLSGVLLMILKIREKQEREEKRAEELLRDYPGFIMKFTLFIQAGMTAREAFRQMVRVYRQSSGEKRTVYEELTVFCNEVDSGVSENDACLRFGERCKTAKYRVFSVLLVQNLQKGTAQLAELLERESLEAWEERKRKARIQGETASTRLLIPMILLMLLVMFIILIPAFLTFYRI